jgi:hypothetical protein
MEIRLDSLDFSQPLRGDGPREATKTLLFPRDVLSAVAGMTGYLTEFSGNDDHHVGKLDIRLATEVSGNAVTVTGRFGLRDWSGTWDDNYDGSVNFVVLADLVSVTAPPARGDLAITGLEFNQGTQFFRANRYLDAANAHPDNSVFLIDGKNTGVRVYVDYDALSGLPAIANLTGELVVSNGTGSTTLVSINPGIPPKRDVLINQALANDTLNFMIPGSLSTGTVTVSCRVFDQADPTQASRSFSRTLVFTPVEPLNVFLVGVQTMAPAAPAPTQAAVAASFSLLQKTYPRGIVQFTGFTTTVLTPNISGIMTTSGCGAGWHTLLDQLRDLRGGSGDIYFGGLPAGISAAGVIGCSPVGQRVAASFIDLIGTVPHEIGHSLGREHAPCRGCSPAAQDPDNNFPQYNTFNSDSIGVFGFDPTTNTVLDPASSLDFMTAFLPASPWISPYTHQALLGPTQGGPNPGGGMTLVGGNHMTLFLGLEIGRDRHVTRRVSFHHMAPLQGSPKCESTFSYELLDRDQRVLDCGPLHCLCQSAGCRCWPKTTRDAIPYPPGAAKLNVYEADGDTPIYEEAIPEPPSVRITGRASTKEGIRVSWDASKDALAYLVHYQVSKRGPWRGLAPRLDTTSIVVPWRLFGQSRVLAVRVLASSGIATGYADTEITASGGDAPSVPDTPVTLVGVGSVAEGSVTVPAVPQVLATDADGAALPDDTIWWYDGKGNSLGRGRSADLRQLGQGRHVVRVVVKGHGGRTVAKSWVVERTGDQFSVHAVMCDPPRPPRKPQHDHPHPAPPPCKE